MTPFEFGLTVKSAKEIPVTPAAAGEAVRKSFITPSHAGLVLTNLLSGIFTGGIAPAAGGIIGGLLMHQLQHSSSTGIREAVQSMMGQHPASSMFFGSVLGQLLARTQMSGARGIMPQTMDPMQPKDSPMSGIEQAEMPEV